MTDSKKISETVEGEGKSVKTPKFTFEDWGWVVICLGMGIGAGIAFLPVEAGMKGLWAFLLAAAFGYPSMYLFQRLFVNTLSESDSCMDYTGVITGYLGKNWGRFLGVLYFLMMVIWFFVYTQTVIKDSAEYLMTFKVVDFNLSGKIYYILPVLAVLVFVASKGEKLLFKLSSVLALTVLTIVLLLAVWMVQYWSFENIHIPSGPLELCKNGIVTLPFVLTSILFLQSLSPMVIYFRKDSGNREAARKRGLRAMNIAFTVLFLIVFFYALSFIFSISRQEAVDAYHNNVSALAIAAKDSTSIIAKILEVLLDIFAVLACFLSVFLGLREACRGLVKSVLGGIVRQVHLTDKKLDWKIAVGLIILGTVMTLINPPIIWYTWICSPIFGIIGCLMPAYLVLKVPKLRAYRGVQLWIIIVMGILLCVSPFMALF